MHSLPVRGAQVAALFGCALLSRVLSAQEVQGIAPSADSVAGKIDPAVMRDLEEIEKRGFLVQGRNRRLVMRGARIVIDLRREATDPMFDGLRVADPVATVAEGVARRQALFTEQLERTLDAGVRQDLRIVDLLTLQYSVVAEITRVKTLLHLAERDDVKFVWKDNLNELCTVEGRNVTGSTAAAASGWTGAGVGVAVIDTHFDVGHPELGGSTTLPNSVVKAGVNFSDPGTSIYSTNFNDCYHGTGTASIVRRYAPGTHLYCLTVFPNAFDSVIANAINWCVTNRAGTGGGSPIRIISMSLGGGRYFSAQTSGTMHTACGNAAANGILCFAASGNDGWTDSMGSPAASTNCISVGATWDANNAPYSPFPPANCSDTSRQLDERTCYSDTASFLSIYAPSEEVICALCGGGTFALGGTSSATPAAAGLTAQLLHARPQYIGDRAGVASLYASTGVAVIGDTSKRRINLTAALGGGGGTVPALSNGVTVNYTVGTGATQAYTIAIPANASNLVVTITGTGDADLYVKRAAINWPADQGAHNEAEFKSPYTGGSAESVTFATPAQATWNVLIHGYAAASGTIRATWTVGTGGTWRTESWIRETPHNYANSRTYTFTYTNASATQVGVHFNRLDTESGYDFVRIKNAAGQTLYTVSGNLITNGVGSAFGRTDGWCYISGNTITIELTTDSSVVRYGFRTDTAAAFY